MKWNRVPAILLCACLGACSEDPSQSESPTPAAGAPQATASQISEAAIGENNRGVALMGRFEYAAAVEAFEAALLESPEWSLARVNHAISVLNRQQPGDEEAALESLSRLLAERPASLDAHYLSGILRFNRGDSEQALHHFQQVTEGDPEDAYAAYFTGQSLLQLGRVDEALAHFQRAIALDGYLRSAYYGEFMVRQRQGDREAARELLSIYQKLDGNPRSRLAEIKYTRMGPRALARSFRKSAEQPESRPAGSVFDPWRELAAFDLDPATTSASVWDNDDQAILLLHDAENTLAMDLRAARTLDGADLPWLQTRGIRASAWGDVNNDGRMDLYLARQGANQLWLNQQSGWIEVASAQGVDDEHTAVDVLIIDADHDGDLDLVLANGDGPDELFSNNADGSFRRLSEQTGLSSSIASRQLLAGDIDNDRDLDLLILDAAGAVHLYRNDRLWSYQHEVLPSPGLSRLRSLAAVDQDVDGQLEVIAVDGEGRRHQWQDGPVADGSAGPGSWVPRPDLVPLTDLIGIRYHDFDGDGQSELLAWGPEGWFLDGYPDSELSDGRWLAVWNGDAQRGPSIIDLHDGRLGIHSPGPARHPFIGLDFAGATDPGQSMRSNFHGVGTRFVLRSGTLWATGAALRPGAGPGQDAQPQLLGLAGNGQLDSLEIDWPDGVFQTEVDLKSGQWHPITETQRQLASCPVIFAWDGQRYAFVSDVLGVGGIGFAVGPGEYSVPRPWENFRLPAGLLQPSPKGFEILIAEPMEEIAYLDRVRLLVVDHPSEFHFVLDERLATGTPEATGELLWYRQPHRPVQASDRQGTSRIAEVLDVDQVAVPPGALDVRFPGLLARESVLELGFDGDLSAIQQPILLMDGWVEYGYSQTSFAAWQAGIRYQPPTLEAQGSDGRWTTVLARFGYPAGMPRESAVLLPDLAAGTRSLRLRTNQEIYWDAVRLAARSEAPEHRLHSLTLAAAEVRNVGFPRRSDGPQRQPGYDFNDREPFWDTRYPAGAYTRHGDALALVADADNALAIVGPGDALALTFDPDLPPPPDGWVRHFVLQLDGWAKDMDLYTRDGETVGPLPRAEREKDRSRELHPIYNTRFLSGR